MGARIVRHADAMRIMNIMALDSWDENASYRASKLVAGAANEFQRMMNEEMNRVAGGMLNDPIWRGSTTVDQREAWMVAVKSVRNFARSRLAYEYTGEQSTFASMLEITDKYQTDAVKEALSELGYSTELGELDFGQISLLQSRLDTQDAIDAYSRKAIVSLNPR